MFGIVPPQDPTLLAYQVENFISGSKAWSANGKSQLGQYVIAVSAKILRRVR